MSRNLSEKVLLYKIRRGDTEAFAEVYDHYNERVYRFVYLKVSAVQDAEDITAETFLKVWQYVREGKAVKNLQAFVYQVARNLIIDLYRKRGTAKDTESLDEYEVVIADRVDLSLEEKMMLRTEMEQVESALRQLKETYRDIIVLHFLNELSLQEVGQVIEKSSGATRVLLHRALKALREVLAQDRGI